MQLPFGRGGPELVFAVADEHYDAFVADHAYLLAKRSHPRVRIVRTSELTDPNTDADLVCAPRRPMAAGRRALFDTLAFESYEQDEAGLVYCNGAPIARTPPVAFGNLRGRIEGLLRPLHEGVFLFSQPLPGRISGLHRMSVVTTPQLLTLTAQPRTVVAPFDPTWLARAYRTFGGELPALGRDGLPIRSAVVRSTDVSAVSRRTRAQRRRRH